MEIFLKANFRYLVLFKLIIVSIAITFYSYHTSFFVDNLFKDELIESKDRLCIVVIRHVKDLVHLFNLMHCFAEDDDNITDGKLVHLPQQQGKIDEVFIEGRVTFDALQVVFVCLVLVALTFTCLTNHVANAPVCHCVLDDACGCGLCGWLLGR